MVLQKCTVFRDVFPMTLGWYMGINTLKYCQKKEIHTGLGRHDHTFSLPTRQILKLGQDHWPSQCRFLRKCHLSTLYKSYISGLQKAILIPAEHLWCDFKCRPWTKISSPNTNDLYIHYMDKSTGTPLSLKRRKRHFQTVAKKMET